MTLSWWIIEVVWLEWSAIIAQMLTQYSDGYFYSRQLGRWTKSVVDMTQSVHSICVCVFIRLAKRLRQRRYQKRINLWSGLYWSRSGPAWTCPKSFCPPSSWSLDPSWTNCPITTTTLTSCRSKITHTHTVMFRVFRWSFIFPNKSETNKIIEIKLNEYILMFVEKLKWKLEMLPWKLSEINSWSTTKTEIKIMQNIQWIN